MPRPSSPSSPAQRSPGPALAVLFGGGALLVVLVFLGLRTRLPAEPAPEAPASDRAALRPAAEEAIALHLAAGDLAGAAAAAHALARHDDTEAAWRRAGTLWMRTLASGQADARTPELAAHALERVRAFAPGDLDVRTDLATAYLSTRDPMRAVAEIKAILAIDSTHAAARFNYGVMLGLIGRVDAALAEFAAVERHSPPGDPYRAQAAAAARRLRAGI